MIALVLASFLYVVDQQRNLAEVRTAARETRTTRQALMAVDRAVLVSMVQSDASASVAYGRALSLLEEKDPRYIPQTVMRGASPVPSKAVLASLKEAWDTIVAHLTDGEVVQAIDTYRARQVERDMGAFVEAFSANLRVLEAEYAATEVRIETATWVSLIGQIATGVVSILAFLYAAQRGAKASRARLQAVATANATREQVMRLFEMTDMLQSANDHQDANAVMRSTANELLPEFGGALYVFNNSRDRLTLSSQWNLPPTEELPDSIGVNHCWALKRGKRHINRGDSSKLCCEHHQGTQNYLEIPMIARGEILGLLQIHCVGETSDVDGKLAQVESMGTALADAMSLALANLGLREKLRGQALKDPLTGLYNRRYMEDTLQRVARLSERERSEVSVIMIDLDHFKRLNDQYGHAKGDSVLRDVAALLIGQLRESDVACRYGGEELTVILPQCGLEDAARKAERLRASIEGLSEPNGARITASMGVASIPATCMSTTDLMSAADAALYQAKQDGRNRVVRAPLIELAKIDIDEDLEAGADADTSKLRAILAAAE